MERKSVESRLKEDLDNDFGLNLLCVEMDNTCKEVDYPASIVIEDDIMKNLEQILNKIGMRFLKYLRKCHLYDQLNFDLPFLFFLSWGK